MSDSSVFVVSESQDARDGREMQVGGTGVVRIRPIPAPQRQEMPRDDRVVMAVGLQTAAIETLTRRVKALESALPPLGKRLTAAQVETIYGIPKKKLWRLSDPRRKGSPIRRFKRVGESVTRFDRVDIEQWLNGVPVESVDDKPERQPGRAAVTKIND